MYDSTASLLDTAARCSALYFQHHGYLQTNVNGQRTPSYHGYDSGRVSNFATARLKTSTHRNGPKSLGGDYGAILARISSSSRVPYSNGGTEEPLSAVASRVLTFFLASIVVCFRPLVP